MIVKIPRKFIDDHFERALPTPESIRDTATHSWIDSDDPAFYELVGDAMFYADPWGPDGAPNITKAAKALLQSLKKQKVFG